MLHFIMLTTSPDLHHSKIIIFTNQSEIHADHPSKFNSTKTGQIKGKILDLAQKVCNTRHLFPFNINILTSWDFLSKPL